MIQSLTAIKKGNVVSAGDTLKMALGLIFGIAADAAVSAALGGLMPAGKGWKHLLRLGGTFVLAMMAGEKTEEYVCKVFDETKAALTEAKNEMTEDQKEDPAKE